MGDRRTGGERGPITQLKRSKARPAPDPLVDAIRLLLNAGVGHREVADLLDIRPGRVRALMAENGLAGTESARKFRRASAVEVEVYYWDEYHVAH